MQFAICNVPAAPVRTEPAHRSEMSNQLLFGDTMEVLEEKGEWLKVKSTYDHYEGWLTWHLINEVPDIWVKQEPFYYATGLTNPITLTDSFSMHPWAPPLWAMMQKPACYGVKIINTMAPLKIYGNHSTKTCWCVQHMPG